MGSINSALCLAVDRVRGPPGCTRGAVREAWLEIVALMADNVDVACVFGPVPESVDGVFAQAAAVVRYREMASTACAKSPGINAETYVLPRAPSVKEEREVHG